MFWAESLTCVKSPEGTAGLLAADLSFFCGPVGFCTVVFAICVAAGRWPLARFEIFPRSSCIRDRTAENLCRHHFVEQLRRPA
jgi:hypothetical protein